MKVDIQAAFSLSCLFHPLRDSLGLRHDEFEVGKLHHTLGIVIPICNRRSSTKIFEF